MIATRDEVQSLARHALTGVGLVLVQLGVGTEAIIEPLAGVAFIVAGLVWSVLDKRQKRKQLAAASVTPMPSAGACSLCGRGDGA
jgi:hypothetical protein